MYRHKKSYQIKYTDADAYDNLKPSSLLAFMEESACLSADELGFGYKDVAPVNKGFIIANWYVEFFSRVKLGDILEIHTWPLPPGKIIFLRDFELFINGFKAGIGCSRWCMIDTHNFSMLPVSAFFKEGAFDGYNTERAVGYIDWKIPLIDCGKKAYSKKVAYSDYDHYFHVNNTKYADFLMDIFSPEELDNKVLRSMQITYVKQCKYGEEIEFFREDCGEYTVVEGRVDGELRVQFKVSFNEI